MSNRSLSRLGSRVRKERFDLTIGELFTLWQPMNTTEDETRMLFEASSQELSTEELEARNVFLWALEREKEANEEGRHRTSGPVNPHDQ